MVDSTVHYRSTRHTRSHNSHRLRYSNTCNVDSYNEGKEVMEKSDHDLLVEVNRDMSWLKDSFTKLSRENAVDHAVITKDIKAAHRRIDGVTLSGILAIIGFILTLVVTSWAKIGV